MLVGRRVEQAEGVGRSEEVRSLCGTKVEEEEDLYIGCWRGGGSRRDGVVRKEVIVAERLKLGQRCHVLVQSVVITT